MTTHRKDKEPTVQRLLRTFPSLLVLTVVALSACDVPGRDPARPPDVPAPGPPDVAYAMRWWNVLSPEQMVAALYGTTATEEQAAAAQKMYADVDDATKAKVNAAAKEIYGQGGYTSVGEWWETLDCRLRRIAAGDGNTADPMSAFCAHYPGSGEAKLLGPDELGHVNLVGMALLDRDDPGVYPADVAYAMRWWNVLSPEQRVAALYGTMATEEQAAAAQKRYAELDPETKKKVNDAAYAINGADEHASVGAWWETLDCRLRRIAAGDGNEADAMSRFCAHYPGSRHETILDDEALEHVNEVGMALLGRTTPGGSFLAPPEWLHGTYETCLQPEIFGGWEFSKHSVVRIYGDGDRSTITESPQAAITEEHGPTWYRIIVDEAGNDVAEDAWDRFAMAEDESSQIIWRNSLDPETDLPLCAPGEPGPSPPGDPGEPDEPGPEDPTGPDGPPAQPPDPEDPPDEPPDDPPDTPDDPPDDPPPTPPEDPPPPAGDPPNGGQPSPREGEHCGCAQAPDGTWREMRINAAGACAVVEGPSQTFSVACP